MSWQNLKTWLKFAIVFSIINAILFLVSLMVYLFGYYYDPQSMAINALSIYAFASYPTTLLLPYLTFSDFTLLAYVNFFILGTIHWFIIGAIIGYMVHLIKST